jgi:NADH dehydrogenase
VPTFNGHFRPADLPVTNHLANRQTAGLNSDPKALNWKPAAIGANLAWTGLPVMAPIRYRSYGIADVDFGRLRLTGRIAWLVWGLAHIYFLIGFRNRMAVAVDWLWSCLTYQRGARLIAGQEM